MKKRGVLLWLGMFGVVLAVSSWEVNARPEISVEEQIAEEDRMAQLEMLAIATYAEAGTQGIEGMRAVAGVILNRVESDKFPNTIEEVLRQKHQFSVMSDGAYERACWNVTQEAYDAVSMELADRKYTEALFFRTGHYHEGRTPLFKLGAHYFSR